MYLWYGAMHRIIVAKLFYILNNTDNESINYKWLCGNRPWSTLSYYLVPQSWLKVIQCAQFVLWHKVIVTKNILAALDDFLPTATNRRSRYKKTSTSLLKNVFKFVQSCINSYLPQLNVHARHVSSGKYMTLNWSIL